MDGCERSINRDIETDMRLKFFSRKKTQKKKSDFLQFVETNSTVPPTGKVVVITESGVTKVFDYFAPKPNDQILKTYVLDILKIKNPINFWYE